MSSSPASVLTLDMQRVEALLPYARNSRTHSTDQVRQIAASIREFGFTAPVLIDSAGGIVAGHGRVMAARQLGLELVPCIRLEYLTPNQVRALVIADNRIALNSGWDYQTLIDELHALESLGEVDLGVVGFDEATLAKLLVSTGFDAPASSARQIDPDGFTFHLTCAKCGFQFNLRKKARP